MVNGKICALFLRVVLPVVAVCFCKLVVSSENKTFKYSSIEDSLMSLLEDSIIGVYNEIPRQVTDENKEARNRLLIALMDKIVSRTNALAYPFDSLKRQISIIDCPQDSLRIINWGVSFFNGRYDYHGLVLRKVNDSLHAFNLHDKSSKIQDPEHLTLGSDNWYGALYYDFVRVGNTSAASYVLLGWDGNDLFTNKKIIDILWFDGDGSPHFGKPVFDMGGEKKSRVIFEYTEKSAMRLRWDSKIDMIVFDHLSPPAPLYQGHNEYYGADFSYDGLAFNGSKWQLFEDIDVRNPRGAKKKK